MVIVKDIIPQTCKLYNSDNEFITEINEYRFNIDNSLMNLL
jgi:hypothetical protein